MITISLCMIVKNEAEVLARCLESVRCAADEIIIVDTGSEDRTGEIARTFTDRVYDFTWVDDFSAARNFSFSLAGMDYQMWLDADDVLPPEEARKLLELKKTLSPLTDVVTMKYNTHFDENGHPVLTSTRGRLFRREAHFVWTDPVHEYVQQRGAIVNADITVFHKKQMHYTDRNLKIYEARLAKGEAFSPRSTYYYARELMDHGRYEEAVANFTAFLDGGRGWVEDNIAACLAVARCCKSLGWAPARTNALLRSFSYDLPRPVICCEIGYDYQDRQDFARAAYWFQAAVDAPAETHGGFVLNDYAGYIPHLELCVCHFRLGNVDRARWHNEQAARSKPESAAVAYNRAIFQEWGQQEGQTPDVS